MDVSFHVAKILRASQGELFIDPITGMPTIYPSIFHALWGLVTRVLGVGSIQLTSLIAITTLVGLFSATYYLARVFVDGAEDAAICALCLPLIFYAPSGRYMMLPDPGNFSFVFLFFGIGALYRYLFNHKPRHLFPAGFLLTIAVSTWSSNIFSVVPIVLLLACYAVLRGPIPPLSHAAVFVAAVVLASTYTVWHLVAVQDVLPNLSGHVRRSGLGALLTTWITTFLTQGNLQFINSFYFWDLSRSALASTGIPVALKVAHALVSVAHYFGLVLPFNFLLIAYTGWGVTRHGTSVVRTRLLRTLAIGGFLVLVSSIGLGFHIPGRDVSHMRRVQFISNVMFLVFAYATVSVAVRANRLRALAVWVCAAALCSLAYTVVNSSRLLTSGIPETDTAIVRFVASIPNHDRERIFMMRGGLHRIVPFVTFRSFVEDLKGQYYLQDPVTALQQYSDFLIIKQKQPDWKKVMHEQKIKLMILRTSDVAEHALFEQYQNEGTVVLQNRDWVILELANQEP